MCSRKVLGLVVVASLAPRVAVAAGGQTKSAVRAGYAATANRDYNQLLLDSGLTTAIWAIRPGPAMELRLDDAGRVSSAGIDQGMDRGLRRYARLAGQQGLELYAKVGFYQDYVKQLKALGPYHQAFVQGPTRYLSPGEKPGPGPLERKYWLGQLLCEAQYIARLSLEHPHLRAFLVDVEMYAGGIMWRWNSSFDDQTFQAVMKLLAAGGRAQLAESGRPVDAAKRYEWLEGQGLLEAYFEGQSRLVEGIAVEFRKAVHAINPRLQLGFMPYEGNWFYQGWARGLGTKDSPVLICSEAEYDRGITPSTRGSAKRLGRMGISARYLPAFHFLHWSPSQLADQAVLANEQFNGYWLFTTYSLWQPKPEALWGPYLLQADRGQYVAALAAANAGQVEAVPGPYHFASGKLLTGNSHFEGPRSQLPLSMVYSVQPDVPFYQDPGKHKLFDGIELDSAGTVAWRADRNESIVVDVDLGRPVRLGRLLLRAAHQLSEHPRFTKGTITVLTSHDGKAFYPLSKRMLVDGMPADLLIRENLGIAARTVRIEMTTEQAKPHAVWAISELALWGSD